MLFKVHSLKKIGPQTLNPMISVIPKQPRAHCTYFQPLPPSNYYFLSHYPSSYLWFSQASYPSPFPLPFGAPTIPQQ